MQWLAEICVRRPVFAVMLTLALVVAGTAAYARLGVDRFPKMDLPTVTVRTSLPGASPEEVESEVSQIIEDAVATVEGIDELRSISSDGASQVMITFNLNRQIDAAAQDVRDAVGSILNRLPRGIDPPVIRKMDTDSTPIMSLVVSGPRTARELYVMADRYVKNTIESARGVGQVQISGASDRAVQVRVEARQLAAYGLSIMQVREALVRQNAEIPGGRVDTGKRELNLRTLGRLPNPRAFSELVVAAPGGSPVRLKDLGEVLDSEKEIRTLARLDGKPAVVLSVYRQSGSNTIEVIRGIEERLTRCHELLPKDVALEVIQDQSGYIKAAMHEVQKHLISGSILASLVVLVFMRSWRSTFIAALAIPASIIATFAMMRVFDFTLNNVTMLALVLMVGVVIDDAIVVLENVFHKIEEEGHPPLKAAVEGTREIGLAVLATTLSLVIVFLPVSFLSSLTGRMLGEFGLTASIAILVSMLVSFSLTPMMCSRLLRPTPLHAKAASRSGLYSLLDAGYTACLRLALKQRWLVALVSVAVIAANVPLYYMVKQDFVPTNVDESEFEVNVLAPEGANLATMDATMTKVENELQQVRGVKHLLTTVGQRGMARVNAGEIFVKLIDSGERTFSLERLATAILSGHPSAAWDGVYSQRDVMTEVRQRMKQFSDLRISVRNLTSLRQGSPVDVDFVLAGGDLDTLARLSDELFQKGLQIPGLVDLDTTLRLDKPELRVAINRERAAALGVDVQEIADTLRVAVGGDDRVSRYHDPVLDDVYDVELRLVGLDRSSRQSISRIYVRATSTEVATEQVEATESAANPLIRLDNLVDFRDAQTPARIDRLDRERMVAVRGNVAPGYALADRLEALKEAAAELDFPPGYYTRVLGRGRELERTFHDFQWTFVLSLIFMYLILAAQFEHLIHPLTILFSLPLAVPFGLLSLWLGDETLNLYSALGILVLFGVVKKNSILQVDHTNNLRAKGLDRTAAIIQANRDRLRPILMTTLSFVAGMLPLMIGTGPGAEERRSIAVLVVGGQTLSLLLTLVATPVVYSIFDDLGRLFVKEKAAEPAFPEPALIVEPVTIP